MKLMINDNSEVVQVERYFRALNNQYLIYSQDGADIDGNVRINVIKIDNDQVVPIEESTEWEALKEIIVDIVNDNRELSKLSVEDLDYQYLENLNVTNVQALRLPSAVMPYLSANQPDFNSLELNEQQLDAKVEALKDMNQDLATMMDEVGKEFATTTNQDEAGKVEEKMGATMEIIMPSKQMISETKEDKAVSKKEKGHFNLKNLFGKKKKKKEEVDVIEETSIQPVQTDDMIVDTPVVEEVTNEVPVMEEIPTSIEETPIVDAINTSNEDIAVIEDPFMQPLATEEVVTDAPVVEEVTNDVPVMEEKPTSIEEIKLEEQNSGFDFFETNQENVIPEPIVVTPEIQVTNEIPYIPEVATEEEPMEILELEEEKYKKLYEEEQQKVTLLEAQVQALSGNIKSLEESLFQYKQRLNEIKSIVD